LPLQLALHPGWTASSDAPQGVILQHATIREDGTHSFRYYLKTKEPFQQNLRSMCVGTAD
jgi:hypothetical protein